jgi:hypothetical protein
LSRIRGRELETETVTTRALKDDAVTKDKIGRYEVRYGKERWPGRKKVGQRDLAPDVVELIEEKAAGGDGIPATITVSAVDVPIASGGDLVEFTGVIRQNLMDGALDGVEVDTPYAGTWQARIELEWDGYSGGLVEFEVDGERVWPVDTFESAQVVEGETGHYRIYEGVTPTFPVDAGSKVSVRVVQTSGETQTLARANLGWTLVEPLEGETEVSVWPPEFTQVYLRGQNKISLPPDWPSSEVLNSDLTSGTTFSRFVSSPDASMVAVGFDTGAAVNTGGILVVRWDNGSVVDGAPTELPAPRGPWQDASNLGPYGVAWSPDGLRIAFLRAWANVSGHDDFWNVDILNTVTWEWETGWPDVILDPLTALQAQGAVAAWSPNSRKLAFIAGGKTHVIDRDTRSYEADWPDYGNGRAILAWSPGGDRLAVYHGQDGSNALKVINVATKTTEGGWPAIGLTSIPLSLGWSPDGRWLAWSGRWGSNSTRSGMIDVETRTRDTDYQNEGFWEDDGWTQVTDTVNLRPKWSWQQAGRYVLLGNQSGRNDRLFDVATGELVGLEAPGISDDVFPPRIFPGIGNGVTATSR